MTCIAIFNQKGGVGKTTTAFNLAAAMVRDHTIPILIDLDPQAHLSHLAGAALIDSSASLYAFYRDHRPLTQLLQHIECKWSILPAHLELSKVDTQFGKGPDVLNRLKMGLRRENLLPAERPIVIDCSPMLGVLSLSAIFAADRVLVPISADYLAVKGAMQVERALNALTRVLKQRVVRRYVLTRFDSRRRMSWDIDHTLREHFGKELCETRIAENVAVAESPYAGKDVYEYAPASRGAQDHLAFYEELKADDFLPAAAAQCNDLLGSEVPAYLEQIQRKIRASG